MATWPTVTDDDGSGTTGTILDQALFNSIRDYIGAAWANVSFSAGNFTASGTMTWTVASGDQQIYRYVEVGKTMHLSVQIATSTVGGTPSAELRVAVPNGRTIQTGASGAFHYLDNGTAGSGVWFATGSTTHVKFQKNAGGTAWTASTDNTYIYATVTFEID